MEKENSVQPGSASYASRRGFMKLCSAVAAVMGVGTAEVAKALTTGMKPPILWLHFAECTGCTESFLRTMDPYVDDLILDVLSVDYHETLMAGAGEKVHQLLEQKAEEYNGQFFCVVEGAIPTADNGIYGTISGKTMLSIAQDICPKAQAILTIGTCAAYGGLPAAEPNPTGAMGLQDALPGLNVPVVNVPGCPPNPINFVAVIASYLLQGTLPACDSYGRPTFAYGRRVHRDCPMKSVGKCLKSKGCKGQYANNNCAKLGFNDNTNFPMAAGHPCIGCSEPEFWDTMTPFYSRLRK